MHDQRVLHESASSAGRPWGTTWLHVTGEVPAHCRPLVHQLTM